MSEQERFDDLVRRKLEERTFPFAEADWQAAEQLMLAERARRRRQRFWPFAAAALLIAGSGIAYLAYTGEEPADHRAGSAAQVAGADERPHATHTPASSHDVVPPPATKGTATPSAATTPTTAPAPAITTAHGTTGRSGSAPQPAAQVSGTGAATLAHDQAEGTTADPVIARDEPSRSAGSAADRPMRADADDPGSDAHPSPSTAGSGTQRAANEEPWSIDDGRPGSAAGEPLTPQGTSAAAPPPSTMKEEEAPSSLNDVEGTAVANEAQVPGEVPQDLAGTQPADSAAASSTRTMALDSTAVASGDTATVPLPLVKPDSPWELSAMGGLLWGRARYNGAQRDLWEADVRNGLGWSAGAEVMHMGRNVGIGTGIHYSTYAERLVAPEISLAEQEVERFYFLTPVDTTVTLGTDTFSVNGQLFHTIISVDTTINVFGVGYDTTTTVIVLRAAREQVNRVSYLEVPLLLDAHLTQGRWMFGLRGGPTLGVLTARRGVLPDPALDGYIDLNDMQFRSLVFGYTARATIRYRWNSAWSVGLEPVLRGQFGNGLEGGLKRSTMAMGAMLSLTHRLR
ncbi:MAG TPA: hypothetical protein PKE21_05560 [Flavobacteriales bacterium]|nr:hypothetical protein [Flavobacteriales bacterium]HMR26927.1 hypothetical protein [Flavobacteriales bacterium]